MAVWASMPHCSAAGVFSRRTPTTPLVRTAGGVVSFAFSACTVGLARGRGGGEGGTAPCISLTSTKSDVPSRLFPAAPWDINNIPLPCACVSIPPVPSPSRYLRMGSTSCCCRCRCCCREYEDPAGDLALSAYANLKLHRMADDHQSEVRTAWAHQTRHNATRLRHPVVSCRHDWFRFGWDRLCVCLM